MIIWAVCLKRTKSASSEARLLFMHENIHLVLIYLRWYGHLFPWWSVFDSLLLVQRKLLDLWLDIVLAGPELIIARSHGNSSLPHSL